MLVARQSTARTVTVGPVLDADGVAVTDGVVADFKISKNGAAPAALNGSATLTHRNTGHYSLALTASDLDTVGTAEVVIDDTTNACPAKEITVVEEAVYDALFASSAAGYQVPIWSSASATVSLTGTTVATVSTLTGHTAQTGDSYARLGAPAGASVSADIAALNDISAADVWAAATRTLTAATNITDTGGTINVDGSGNVSAFLGDGLIHGGNTAVWIMNTATVGGGTILTEGSVDALVDAVWDEATSGHASAGTTGKALTDILADTNELQGDWANGGRLDLLLDSAIAHWTDAIAELTADAGATPTPKQAMMLLYMALRNKVDVDATTKEIHNNAGTVLLTKTLSDDGTTYSESKMA